MRPRWSVAGVQDDRTKDDPTGWSEVTGPRARQIGCILAWTESWFLRGYRGKAGPAAWRFAMDFGTSVKLEFVKTLLSGFTLLLGWFVGQRIVAYWDLKEKRQEVDLALATQFQHLYGDFKQISRLWRSSSSTAKGTSRSPFRTTLPSISAPEPPLLKVALRRSSSSWRPSATLNRRTSSPWGCFGRHTKSFGRPSAMGGSSTELTKLLNTNFTIGWPLKSPLISASSVPPLRAETPSGRIVRNTLRVLKKLMLRKSQESPHRDPAATLRKVIDIRPERWDEELRHHAARVRTGGASS
jgi:hypothetical protein